MVTSHLAIILLAADGYDMPPACLCHRRASPLSYRWKTNALCGDDRVRLGVMTCCLRRSFIGWQFSDGRIDNVCVISVAVIMYFHNLFRDSLLQFTSSCQRSERRHAFFFFFFFILIIHMVVNLEKYLRQHIHNDVLMIWPLWDMSGTMSS